MPYLCLLQNIASLTVLARTRRTILENDLLVDSRIIIRLTKSHNVVRPSWTWSCREALWFCNKHSRISISAGWLEYALGYVDYGSGLYATCKSSQPGPLAESARGICTAFESRTTDREAFETVNSNFVPGSPGKATLHGRCRSDGSVCHL